MVSPNWDEIAEKFVEPDIEGDTKDYTKFFGSDAKNQLHNEVFEQLRSKKKKGDLHKYAIVKNYEKMLPGIQAKLLRDHKVVHYQYNGKDIYRSNTKWTPEELTILKNLSDTNVTDKNIAKSLGRSSQSVKRKRQRLKL